MYHDEDFFYRTHRMLELITYIFEHIAEIEFYIPNLHKVIECSPSRYIATQLLETDTE
jgi:hypothetical protein